MPYAIISCKSNFTYCLLYTYSTDYGTGDMKRSEVVATEPHKDHPDKVGYSEFHWYFNLDSSGPLLKNKMCIRDRYGRGMQLFRSSRSNDKIHGKSPVFLFRDHAFSDAVDGLFLLF